MRIAVPKETDPGERRVALVPEFVSDAKEVVGELIEQLTAEAGARAA